MGQPQRTVAIRVDVSDVCPACGSVNTVVSILLETELSGSRTINSREALDSRCIDCANVWRPERVTH